MTPTSTDDAEVFAEEFDDIREFLRVHEPVATIDERIGCLGCDEVTDDRDYSEHLVRIMRRTMVLRTPEEVDAQPDGSVIVTLEGAACQLDSRPSPARTAHQGERVFTVADSSHAWPVESLELPVLLVWKPEDNR